MSQRVVQKMHSVFHTKDYFSFTEEYIHDKGFVQIGNKEWRLT